MARTSASHTSSLAGALGLAGLGATIREHVQDILKSLRNPYRPERHYMRGPGPKWREKHAFARR